MKAARSSSRCQLVKEIITSENGRVSVADDGRIVATTSAETPAPRSLRLLLADDSPVNQMIARRHLAKDEHNITVVANGLEAVRAMAGQCYDLVLMSMGMPEADGLEGTL